VTAVETTAHLDSWGVRMVPGDIKPENALLDEKGYAKAVCQCQLMLRCGEGQEHFQKNVYKHLYRGESRCRGKM